MKIKKGQIRKPYYGQKIYQYVNRPPLAPSLDFNKSKWPIFIRHVMRAPLWT